MRPTEKKIQNLIQNLKENTRPELDEKILNDCFAELHTEKSSAPAKGPTIWSIIMHSKSTKPIAAAIIIIAAILSLTIWNKTVPSVYAIEQTVEALKGIRNLRITMEIGSKSTEMLMLINQQTGIADHIRMDTLDSGDVTITVPGQTYMYNKKKNEVTFVPQELLQNDLNFKDVINSLIEQTNASAGQIKIVKIFNRLAQQEVITVTITRQDESVAGEFLIDPENNLPLYIGTVANEQLNYMGPIKYDVELPINAFSFLIPENATVIDNRPEELKFEKPESEKEQGFGYDLSETAMAIKKAYNVHGTWIDRKGRRIRSWGHINPATGLIDVMRMEYEDGGLYIMANGKTYFEDDGMVAIKDGSYIKSNLLFNDFISSAAQRVQEQDEITVQKQFSEEFQCEVIRVDYKNPYVHLEAIVDLETKLPIKFKIPWVQDPVEPLDYTELIEYNVDLPPGFFDFEVGPDVMTLGKELDTQFAKDPAYGMTYNDSENVQEVCERIAIAYLQAKNDRDIETIKQLHPIHINRYGSNKMIEKNVITEEYENGRIVDVLGFKSAYEYHPRQMMLPCKVIKEHGGQKRELFSGIIVYLREHEGKKSAVITGFFPWLSDKQVNNTQ